MFFSLKLCVTFQNLLIWKIIYYYLKVLNKPSNYSQKFKKFKILFDFWIFINKTVSVLYQWRATFM